MKFNTLTVGTALAGAVAAGTLGTGSVQAAAFTCSGTGLGGTDCSDVSIQDAFASGFSYQVGDKIFDNFRNFTSVASGGATAPTAAEVFFTGFKASETSYYLTFTSSLWKATSGQTVDTDWLYDITSVGAPINGIDLTLQAFNTSGSGEINIEETAYLPPYSPDASSPNTVLAKIGVSSEGPVSAIAFFDPVEKITVAKDIAVAGLSNGTASISSFNNSVQQVPTPALLPGLIGMGVAALRKRQGDSEEAEA